ncbi:glycosyltransferase family 4 protein [bacterium]|nr:glycosyltransferase family 4 protein [bacterium]
MNILIHDYHGTPPHFDLSKELAQRDFQITHVYNATCGGPKADFNVHINNLKVISLKGKILRKDDLINRYFEEQKYGCKIYRLLCSIQPDLIISANTPTDPEGKIVRYVLKNNIPFIFWLKDLRSLAVYSVLSKKFGLPGRIIGKYYIHKEQKIMKSSRHIISLTEDFLPVLKSWEVNAETTVIPDWTPINDFPLRDRKNSFSSENKIHDKFVVLYAGSLGLKHNPEMIIQAAEKLKDISDIVFLVVSEGIGVEILKNAIKQRDLTNILIKPFQDYGRLPDVLASADVILTILDNDASQYCVPSKVWTGYCSGKASLLVAPEANLVSRITRRINAGLIVEPDNLKAFIDAILKLYHSEELRNQLGNNGRNYAQSNYRIEVIADKFESIMTSIK